MTGANSIGLVVNNTYGTANTEISIDLECGSQEVGRISAVNTGSDIGDMKFWTASSASSLSRALTINSGQQTTFSGDIYLSGTERLYLGDSGALGGSIHRNSNGQIDIYAGTTKVIQLTAANFSHETGNASFAGTVTADKVTVGHDTGIEFSDGGTIKVVGSGDLEIKSAGGDLDIEAAQTVITSVTNAALVLGRDADNDIDFSVDNNITFRAAGADQIKLVDGVIAPVTDNDIALGTTALRFSDLFLAEGGVINLDDCEATLTKENNGLSWLYDYKSQPRAALGYSLILPLVLLHRIGLALSLIHI